MKKENEEFTKRLLTDEAFRERFRNDPKGAFSELGIDVPDDVEIEVVESNSTKHYVVLPPLRTDELSVDEIDSVRAGTGAMVGVTQVFNNICSPGGSKGLPN